MLPTAPTESSVSPMLAVLSGKMHGADPMYLCNLLHGSGEFPSCSLSLDGHEVPPGGATDNGDLDSLFATDTHSGSIRTSMEAPGRNGLAVDSSLGTSNTPFATASPTNAEIEAALDAAAAVVASGLGADALQLQGQPDAVQLQTDSTTIPAVSAQAAATCRQSSTPTGSNMFSSSIQLPAVVQQVASHGQTLLPSSSRPTLQPPSILPPELMLAGTQAAPAAVAPVAITCSILCSNQAQQQRQGPAVPAAAGAPASLDLPVGPADLSGTVQTGKDLALASFPVGCSPAAAAAAAAGVAGAAVAAAEAPAEGAAAAIRETATASARGAAAAAPPHQKCTGPGNGCRAAPPVNGRKRSAKGVIDDDGGDGDADDDGKTEDIQRLPKEARELRGFKLQMSQLLQTHSSLTAQLVELSSVKFQLFAQLTKLQSDWRLLQNTNTQLRSDNEALLRALEALKLQQPTQKQP